MNEKIKNYGPEEVYNIIDINKNGSATVEEWLTLDANLRAGLEEALMEHGMTISDCFIYKSDLTTLQAEYLPPPLLPKLLPLLDHFGADDFEAKFREAGRLLSKYSAREAFEALKGLDAVRQARALTVISYYSPEVFEQLRSGPQRLTGFRYFDNITYKNPDGADRYTTHVGLFATLASLHDGENTEALNCEHGEKGILPVTPTSENVLGIWPQTYNSDTLEKRIFTLASAGCYVFDLDSYDAAKGTFEISSQKVYGLDLPDKLAAGLSDADPEIGLETLFKAFKVEMDLSKEVACAISGLSYIDQARVLIALEEFDEGAYQEIRNSGLFPDAFAITEQLQIYSTTGISSRDYTLIAFTALMNGRIGGYLPSQTVNHNTEYPFLKMGNVRYLVQSYDPRGKQIVVVGEVDSKKMVLEIFNKKLVGENIQNGAEIFLQPEGEEVEELADASSSGLKTFIDGMNWITQPENNEEKLEE